MLAAQRLARGKHARLNIMRNGKLPLQMLPAKLSLQSSLHGAVPKALSEQPQIQLATQTTKGLKCAVHHAAKKGYLGGCRA